MLLFELFLIGKNKTEQSNCIWLEINQSNCTIHVRKLAWFSHAVINVRNIRKALGWFSESIPTLSKMIFLHYAKISRHLQVFELRGLAGTCLVMSQASSSATTHNWNIPDVAEKIKRFPVQVKSFRNTATYQKLKGRVPWTTVGDDVAINTSEV